MTGDFEREGRDDRSGARASGPFDQPTHYAVLDVEPGATRVEIREAFLRLKSTYGAGSAALYGLIGEDEAKDQLARAEEAFRILSDDIARRDYDVRMGFARPGPGPKAPPPELSQAAGGGFGSPTERLMFMRETAQQTLSGASSVGAWDDDKMAPSAPESGAADPSVIRTSRSVLQVIKLKANKLLGSSTDEIAAKYAEIIAESDPGDGDLYKRLREAAEVAEDEIADRTKVSIAYIRAIEGNRFDRLPQAVYVKGFLRSYFRFLAVPEAEKLVAAFSARLVEWQTNRKG